jgi:hypoxanthine phosphoribosyltransferase (EC 2.4.2.8)
MSKFDQPQLTVLFDTGQIQTRIQELGAAITRDYAGRTPLFVVVLKGAVPFGADLVRAVDLPLTLDFIAVSSYGLATKSSGEVRLLKDLDMSLRGQDVIIVEDIVDTGLTLSYLLDIFYSS